MGEDRRTNAERRQGEPHQFELISDERYGQRREGERRTMPRASFEATNLRSQEKDALARSPEEIRRKLEARQNQTSGSRAIFTAKDIEPIVPPKPK